MADDDERDEPVFVELHFTLEEREWARLAAGLAVLVEVTKHREYEDEIAEGNKVARKVHDQIVRRFTG